ncbi:hypothetical protein ACOSQ4_027508 [Xanthoceras sorbifolium]
MLATGGWNFALIKSRFLSLDAKDILKLPLPACQRPDAQIWHFTKEDIYSVKSGYW